MPFCEWCSSKFRLPFIWLVAILQVASCIAIINIIFWHLTDYTSSTSDIVSGSGSVTDYTCLLQGGSSRTLCTYGYALSGISIGLTLLVMASVCFSCTCWAYVDVWFEWVLTLLATLAWLAASLVLTSNNVEVSKYNPEQQSWRNTVNALSWVLTLLYFLQYLISQSRLCYKVCGCCGGREERQRRRAVKAQKAAEMQAKPQHDVEAATTTTATVPPAAVTATTA